MSTHVKLHIIPENLTEIELAVWCPTREDIILRDRNFDQWMNAYNKFCAGPSLSLGYDDDKYVATAARDLENVIAYRGSVIDTALTARIQEVYQNNIDQFGSYLDLLEVTTFLREHHGKKILKISW